MVNAIADSYGSKPMCTCEHMKESHIFPGGKCGMDDCFCERYSEVAEPGRDEREEQQKDD